MPELLLPPLPLLLLALLVIAELAAVQ